MIRGHGGQSEESVIRAVRQALVDTEAAEVGPQV
jgi:hypothetical protein